MDRLRWFLANMTILAVVYAVWRFGPPSLKLPAVYAMFLLPVVALAARWPDNGCT
jgi:hypothetical protein